MNFHEDTCFLNSFKLHSGYESVTDRRTDKHTVELSFDLDLGSWRISFLCTTYNYAIANRAMARTPDCK